MTHLDHKKQHDLHQIVFLTHLDFCASLVISILGSMIGGHLDQQGLRGTQRSGWKDRLIFTFLFPPWREEGWSRGAQGPQSGHASSARRPPPFYPALHIWKYIQLSFINHLNINIFRNIFLLVRIYRKLKSLVEKRKKKNLKKLKREIRIEAC